MILAAPAEPTAETADADEEQEKKKKKKKQKSSRAEAASQRLQAAGQKIKHVVISGWVNFPSNLKLSLPVERGIIC